MRCTGVEVHRGRGAQGLRCTGVEVHRGQGEQGLRCIGVEVHRGVSPMRCHEAQHAPLVCEMPHRLPLGLLPA